MRASSWLIVGILAAAQSTALADNLDPIGKSIAKLQTQMGDLERVVRPPSGPPAGDPEAIERRLIQAQVAYGVGRYADASLLLYDIVEKYPRSRSYPEALFYLADALFQKGDNQLARGYFHRIVDDGGPQAAHYQDALERLIEISLRLQDTSRVSDYLAKLEAIPAGKRADSVPYVRGKYAYHTGAFDEALRFFDQIKNPSNYYFQARYFAGTTQVAKGDLGEAARIYHELIRVPTKGEDDQKVLELTHLALGRIHYERDQATDAVDHYLLISSKSPFYDEALFEVAWVHVKARQFDKALRALELLALANPKSAKLPDVRILEGNLRIRKAQAVAATRGNSVEEYAKANNVFEETRDTYDKPRLEVERVLASRADPRQFFHQLVGRAGKTFEVQVELPDVVVAWLREEKTVARAVNVGLTLDEIRKDLAETEATIARLERAIAAPSRVALFPLLAGQRGRAQEIQQGAFRARQELATHERALVERRASAAEVARLGKVQDARRKAAQKLASIPGNDQPYIERVRKSRASYVELDKKLQEREVFIISLEAQLVALDKYHADTNARGEVVLAPRAYNPQMRELKGLVVELREELDAIRQEILLASDEAGITAALIKEETEARANLDKALDDERAAMAPIVARMSGEEKARADKIATLMAQAEKVENTATALTGRIEGYVDAQLSEAKSVIVEEKGHVLEYQSMLASYDGESVDVGGEIVGGSFDAVAKKFYEIAIRADVGLLDVSWSEHEQASDEVDRLRMEHAQEKNALEQEIRTVEKEVERVAPAPPAAPPVEAPGKEGGDDAEK